MVNTSLFEEIKGRSLAEVEALEKSPYPKIRIGTATCGRASGALEVLAAINSELEARGLKAIVLQVGCLGPCYIEPIMDIQRWGGRRIFYANVTPEKARQLVKDYLIDDNPRPDLALGTLGEEPSLNIPSLFGLPMLRPQVRIVLRNCGHIDPESINQYIATGGYQGLVRALGLSPQEVIEEVKKSGLRGRGGAGFPTGQKWQFCRNSPGTIKYVICNADEGDPGAFMNRSLLEGDPHAVLEGLLIAGYAIGSQEGYIYCRAEYPLALDRLRTAIGQMRRYGLLGQNILDSDFGFDIKIREGAGAFVCGEETALIASIEGRRGMPRPRPPFPAVKGLWGKPTNINNVETLGTVPSIMREGAEWFASYGTEKSKGTKTFSLVGKVKNTGLIEMPLGSRLGEVIHQCGGGILGDKKFKAVQTGGPSGGCISATKAAELTIDYEALAAAGSIMGSGGLIVMDEDTCVVDLAKFFLDFTKRESCGKCVPCRIGLRHMHAILERIAEGKGQPEDLERLVSLGNVIRNGSLCGLGQTAPNPALTTLRYFPEEYRAHVEEKRCPALVCKALINYYIVAEKCQACMLCLRNCPVGAVQGGKNLVHWIDQDKCTKCGTCLEVCPARFGAVVKLSGVKVPEPPAPGTDVVRQKAVRKDER